MLKFRCLISIIAILFECVTAQISYASDASRAKDKSGEFKATTEKEQFHPDIKIINGVVNGPVLNSMITAGVTRRIANEVINRMSHMVNFRTNINKGDTFQIKYNVDKDDNGNIVNIGDLLSASFETPHRTYKVYRFEDSYYNEKGENENTYLLGKQQTEFINHMHKIDKIKDGLTPNKEKEAKKLNELRLIEDSITLMHGTKEYFYIYTGSDISKEKLDKVIKEIRNEIGYNVGFSIHDNEIAAELAYMNWVSMASYSSFSPSFRNNMEYCYNYKREHSLVEADSSDFIVFSNYELDEKYQKYKHNGTYKYCKPKEFIQQNIQKTRNIDNQRKKEYAKLQQISSNRQLQQQCLGIIRTKFRYVNDLSFNDNIHIDQKNDIYTFSGVLNVEATNGTKATAEYKCIYSDSKKEFVDWFVGEMKPVN